tara:strand:- start:191 stop:388 length:198 start_codon:yes stop_codon:yes gene_type:complete
MLVVCLVGDSSGKLISVWNKAIKAPIKTINNAEKNPMRKLLTNFCLGERIFLFITGFELSSRTET